MTVAELKRRLKPGTKIQSVWNQTSFKPATDPFFTTVGVVTRVMSTQFTVVRAPWKTSESYMDWPKASELEETPGGFRITKAPNLIVEYKFVD